MDHPALTSPGLHTEGLRGLRAEQGGVFWADARRVYSGGNHLLCQEESWGFIVTKTGQGGWSHHSAGEIAPIEAQRQLFSPVQMRLGREAKSPPMARIATEAGVGTAVTSKTMPSTSCMVREPERGWT
jgi:hypothetical protein